MIWFGFHQGNAPSFQETSNSLPTGFIVEPLLLGPFIFGRTTPGIWNASESETCVFFKEDSKII
jgi:hypothetical protein